MKFKRRRTIISGPKIILNTLVMKPHVMGMKLCLDLQKLPLEIEAETAEISTFTVIRTRNVPLT